MGLGSGQYQSEYQVLRWGREAVVFLGGVQVYKVTLRVPLPLGYHMNWEGKPNSAKLPGQFQGLSDRCKMQWVPWG